MVTKTKLYSRLDVLESQLEEHLLAHLKIAAAGGNDQIFCVTAFNPFKEFKFNTDKLTEELVEMGAQILSLREKLGEPFEGTIAERLCWYCREWGDMDKHQRLSAVGLAQKFLEEIEPR